MNPLSLHGKTSRSCSLEARFGLMYMFCRIELTSDLDFQIYQMVVLRFLTISDPWLEYHCTFQLEYSGR